MFEHPQIPHDIHEARARRLRAEAAGALFAQLVAYFRRETACDDCGKPVVIS
ncbi:MAG: hypothetical protein NBV67_15445 [Tagaea sp.]|nr:hypothetical protein [Tagaea sp.]